jgi:hypothetical protein
LSAQHLDRSSSKAECDFDGVLRGHDAETVAVRCNGFAAS